MALSGEGVGVDIVRMENAYMATVIGYLVEAVSVLREDPGYEGIPLDDRLTIARSAIELVPTNIAKRRRGHGVDLSERLVINDTIGLDMLPFANSLKDALSALGITKIGDIRATSDEDLKHRALASEHEVSLLRHLVS